MLAEPCGAVHGLSSDARVRVLVAQITQRSLGYAYVNFTTHEGGTSSPAFAHSPCRVARADSSFRDGTPTAEAAFRTLSDARINGKPCRVAWVQRNPEARRSGVGNIFVKELPPSLTTPDLIALFEEFGTVVSARVVMNGSGQSKVR